MTPTVVRIDQNSPTGTVLDASTPLIRIDDEGYTRGDGVFETMLAVDGSIRKFDLHLTRLGNSARLLHLPNPSEDSWRSASALALKSAGNGTPSSLGAEHTVKLLISRGTPEDGPYGLVVVSSVPDSTIAQREEGVKALLLPRGHDPAEDTAYPWLLAGAKTLSYAVNMAVLRHVRSLGAQEAIFTASDRRILEAATSSVIMARQEGDRLRLFTPEPNRGILPGTTQGAIFQGAREAGWEVGFGPLYPTDLMESDGVWLTSSVRLLAPVTHLNNQELVLNPGLTGELMNFLRSR
ncbi:aminotransferase class IV [Kocuria sp. TGY1127_2]|uniref:aminotransferase class IV n=1 Tax=Kocuria sp. TGY1127_2 TaxID=2711328 RepID=UPI0015C0AF77|nr:aminotransferase class IV [Kocuria sp. TGY1127_2]